MEAIAIEPHERGLSDAVKRAVQPCTLELVIKLKLCPKLRRYHVIGTNIIVQRQILPCQHRQAIDGEYPLLGVSGAELTALAVPQSSLYLNILCEA